MKMSDFNKALKHAWLEPKAALALEAPSPALAELTGGKVEGIDPDWWEPRYDQPWRRQVARDRDAFGGEYVASAKPPVEGPNNPNRLRHELEWAQTDLANAEWRRTEAENEYEDAQDRIDGLGRRLEEVA